MKRKPSDLGKVIEEAVVKTKREKKEQKHMEEYVTILHIPSKSDIKEKEKPYEKKETKSVQLKESRKERVEVKSAVLKKESIQKQNELKHKEADSKSELEKQIENLGVQSDMQSEHDISEETPEIYASYTDKQREDVEILLKKYSVPEVFEKLKKRIPLRTLYNWKEKLSKGKLLERKEGSGRHATYPELENELFDWFLFKRERKIPVSFSMLKETAQKLAMELKIDGFKASNGWVENFETRHNLESRSVTRKCQNTVGQMKPLFELFFCKINSAIEKFDEHHIWNYDEIPIYFQPEINRTIDFKGTSTVSIISQQAQKKRLTLILLICADGTMAPPILLFKDKGFKNFAIDFPNALLISNPNAYNTVVTMVDKILPHFYKIVKIKSVIIHDKCSAHINKRVLDELKSHEFETIEIPGGATCLLQPIDCSCLGKKIKENIKQQYIKWSAYNFEEIVTPVGKRQKTFKQPNNELVAQWSINGVKTLTESDIKISFINTGILSKDNQVKIINEKLNDYYVIVKNEDFDFLHIDQKNFENVISEPEISSESKKSKGDTNRRN